MADARERFQAKYRRPKQAGEPEGEDPVVNSSVLPRDGNDPERTESDRASDEIPNFFDDLPDTQAEPPSQTQTELPADLRQSTSREVRGLATECQTEPLDSDDDRMHRRMRRASQYSLGMANDERVLGALRMQRNASLCTMSLFS